MKLIPLNDERLGLSGLQRQMSRLFDDFFGPGESAPSNGAAWGFPADVEETAEALVVRAEIPGVDPKQIEVSVLGDELQIKAERQEERERKGASWLRTERRYGLLHRTIPLPCAVRADKVEAVADNGVLTVTLPKAEEAKTRRIEVRVN
ncbi:MAG: Hsp20/alpha crystallin family protein [Planctomycetota bacterium]